MHSYLLSIEHPLYAEVNGWWHQGLLANNLADEAVTAILLTTQGTPTGNYANSSTAAFGGISWIEFEVPPPTLHWKRHRSPDLARYYAPSARNKNAIKIIESLPTVSWVPLLNLLGMKRQPVFPKNGKVFHFSHPMMYRVAEGYLIEIHPEVPWEVPAGITLVTAAQAEAMKEQARLAEQEAENAKEAREEVADARV